MFNDAEGFYTCNTMDLTTNIQQQHQSCYDKSKPLWMRADERFFWNRHMMKELIESGVRQYKINLCNTDLILHYLSNRYDMLYMQVTVTVLWPEFILR